MSKAMKGVIKRLRFPFDIMSTCVRWYLAYALSFRNLEEMMQERGVFVDHSTIHRWVIKLTPGGFPETKAQARYRRGRQELENRRDVYQDSRRGSVLVSRRG
jgi:transposase-like protein